MYSGFTSRHRNWGTFRPQVKSFYSDNRFTQLDSSALLKFKFTSPGILSTGEVVAGCVGNTGIASRLFALGKCRINQVSRISWCLSASQWEGVEQLQGHWSPSLFYQDSSLSAGEGVGGNGLKETEGKKVALSLACPHSEQWRTLVCRCVDCCCLLKLELWGQCMKIMDSPL